MANFKTLSQADIDEIVGIMDTILKTQSTNHSVLKIRQKHKLTSEQYNMVYDLCMPMIRKMGSSDSYWKARYGRFKMRIVAALRQDRSETAEKVREVISTDNEQAKKLDEQYHIEQESNNNEMEENDIE